MSDCLRTFREAVSLRCWLVWVRAEDALWPGADWSPMILDRPLSEGACGGHGNVRYTCTAYVPGKLVEFTFDSVHGRAVDGRHVFEAIPRKAGTMFRHTLDFETDFSTWLTLNAVVVPAHDAVLEQLLDNLELAATGSVERFYRWPSRVRLIRRRFGLPTQMSGCVNLNWLLCGGLKWPRR